MHNNISGGDPADVRAPHSIRLHDWMDSVEPPVADDKGEEGSGLAKLGLVYVTDVPNERSVHSGRIA